ncbi:MAG: hypothetical protein KatS3mg077_1807 [Candidatus Binatia bacterium]|nr:MAG: hypothetical protein KatS3mg077_1807 [Candidatus Binatia bacterium]
MARRVWPAAVVASTLYFGVVPEADNDLWMHLFAGRWILQHGAVPRADELSYTAYGSPWTDHEWLWQVAAFWVFDSGGSRALFLLKLVFVGLCVAMCACALQQLEKTRAAACREEERPTVGTWPWGITMILVIPVLARGWAMRPQLTTYVLLPALLAALAVWERGYRRISVAIVLGFAFWVNAHGGVLLGLVALALFAGFGVFGGHVELLRRAVLLLAAFAATWLNPYGPGLYAYLADELGRPHPISEWQPVSLASEHLPFILLALVFVATLAWLPRRPPFLWRSVLALAVLGFALRHQRHTPVFALCVVPLLFAQFHGAAASLRGAGLELSLAAQRIVLAGVAIIAALQIVAAAASLRDSRARFVFDPREYPVRAVQALRDGRAEGNLAVPLDWGGYVLWHLAPAIKPSLDGRFATVYPTRVVADNFAFFRGEPGWRRLLLHYPTEAVLLPAGTVHPLQREPGWVRVYSDGVAVLYVRQDRLAAFAVSASEPEKPILRWFP